VYNVASCWLQLKEYINDARYYERQNEVGNQLYHSETDIQWDF